MDLLPFLFFTLALTAALLPAFLFLLQLRNAEERRREPWRGVLLALLAGMAVAGAVALFLRPVFERSGLPPAFLLFALTPLLEEPSKALGLVFVRDDDVEPEDGLIYGGCVGLGFALVENVLLVTAAYALGGVPSGLATAFYRGLATPMLHAATSATAGYGLWRARRTGSAAMLVPSLALAILMHAVYNALASVQLALGLVAALAFALLVYRRVLKRIRALDARA